MQIFDKFFSKPSDAAQVQQGAVLICIPCFTESGPPEPIDDDIEVGLAPGAAQEMLDFIMKDE